MKENEITLRIPIGDRELTQALFDAGVNFETSARYGLAFDSAEMYAYIDLIKYLSPLAGVIIYYINRNRGKRFVITLKNGTKIEIVGYSQKEVEKLLEMGTSIYMVDESE